MPKQVFGFIAALSCLSVSACDLLDDEMGVDVGTRETANGQPDYCDNPTLVLIEVEGLVRDEEPLSNEAFSELVVSLKNRTDSCLLLAPVDDAPHGVVVDAFSEAREAGVSVFLTRHRQDG